MMGLYTWIAAFTVGILSIIYMTFPEPVLTPKLQEWRNSGQFFKFKGYHIFYKVVGGRSKDGSTVLCLHGFPTSSHDWIKILDDLQREFSKIIMYDYIGFGLSDKPTNHTYSIMEQVDIGEAILKSLGITKVHLLSHDKGDTVAIEYLARYNNNENIDRKPVIQSLCLTNGGYFVETISFRLSQKLLLNPYLGPIAPRFTNFFIFSKIFAELFGNETVPSKDELYDFYVMLLHKGGHIIGHKLMQYQHERVKFKDRWVGALQNTAVKVHMIYGDKDPVVHDFFLDFYKKTVPNHGITVLNNIGHFPQWEAPKELIKAYIDFVAASK